MLSVQVVERMYVSVHSQAFHTDSYPYTFRIRPVVVKANLNFFAIHPNRNEANSMLHVRIGLIRTSFKDDSCIFCIIDYQKNGQSHHVSLLKYFFLRS